MAHTAILLSGAALLAMQVAVASAETPVPCGKHEEIAQKLGESFAEAPLGIGVAQSGEVFEIFTSAAGTWTVLVTLPGGVSCLLAAGADWQSMARPPMAMLGPKA